jgi:dynein assembly factor 2
MATKEEFNPTEKELSSISEAFKKEEFRKLFFEYAEELNDPVKRKQYEDELNQMEMEKNPNSKGLNFLHQEPHHFIEILDTTVFINITTSEKVDKPEMKVMKSPEGKSGFGFEIPCSVSPSVREIGKKRKIVDVCFHPDTVRMGETNNEFMKNNVRDIAIEQVNHFHKLDLKREFKIGTTGKSMGNVDQNIKITEPKVEEGDEKAEKKDLKGLLKKLTDQQNQKATLEDKISKNEAKHTELSSHIDHMKSKLDGIKPKTKPKYKIKQSYKQGLSKNSDLPDHLLVEVELPEISDKTMITSDVEKKWIVLEFDQEATNYENLKILLPNEIELERTRVKWFKNKRQLVFTCPVKNDGSQARNSEIFDDKPKMNHSGISEVSASDLEAVQKANLKKAFAKEQEKEQLAERQSKVKFQEPEAEVGELISFEDFTAVEDRLYVTITIKGDDLPRDWRNMQNMFFSEKKQNFCFSANLEFNESTTLDFASGILNIRVSSPSKQYVVVQFRKTEIASATKTCVKKVTLANEAFSKTVVLFDEDKIEEKKIVKPLPEIDYAGMFKGGLENGVDELDSRIDSLQEISNEIKQMEALGGKKYLEKQAKDKKAEKEKFEKSKIIEKTAGTVIQSKRGRINDDDLTEIKEKVEPISERITTVRMKDGEVVEEPVAAGAETINPPTTEKINFTNDLLDDLD